MDGNMVWQTFFFLFSCRIPIYDVHVLFLRPRISTLGLIHNRIGLVRGDRESYTKVIRSTGAEGR